MRTLPVLGPNSRVRAGRIAFGALLAGLALAWAWAFDWTWCRPLIRHYVMSHSGRAIEFDHLDVRFDRASGPTIEFRGLTIQNAAWAANKEPFVRAGRVAVTLSWRTLWEETTVVSLIVLEDARVDLEQQADGLRNWRLAHPDDRGPPKVRVLALDARRSQLDTIHGGQGIEAHAEISDLPAPQPVAGRPDQPLTRRLVVAGRYRGHAFDGDAAVSDVLAFGGSARRFGLRGVGHLGAWRLEAAGLTSDIRRLENVDLDVRIATDATGSLWPLPQALSRVRPIVAHGHVNKTGATWSGTGLHVRAGRHTELAGDLSLTGGPKTDRPRRALKAMLRAVVLGMDDIAALRGKTPAGAGRVFSAAPLDLAPLRDLDAEVDLGAARFVGAAPDGAQSLRAQATLAGGVLRLRSLDIGVAGGHLTGTAELDAAHTPARAAVDVSARGLRLDRLAPPRAAGGGLAGALDGHAALTAHGDSPRDLAASAKGTLEVSLAPGATVSKRLDAKLGLDGGRWLRSLFDPAARVPVACGALSLVIDRGVARSRHLALETANTVVTGQLRLNLADETLDATLMPMHRRFALFALDRAIHAQGSWNDVRFSLRAPTADAPAPARCTAASPAQNATQNAAR